VKRSGIEIDGLERMDGYFSLYSFSDLAFKDFVRRYFRFNALLSGTVCNLSLYPLLRSLAPYGIDNHFPV
jgi:hypothetical protein